MYINVKNTEDDAGNCAFFIGGEALSTICERNKAILYIMGVEDACVKLFTEFMGCSAIKSIGIHDGTAREAGKVEDEVLDNL